MGRGRDCRCGGQTGGSGSLGRDPATADAETMGFAGKCGSKAIERPDSQAVPSSLRRLAEQWLRPIEKPLFPLGGCICRAQQAVRRVVDDLRNQQFALTATAQGGKPAGEINANSGATHPATADGGAGHDDESAAAKKAILKQMESAVRKAYWSYQYAVTKVEKKELEDREAYQLLEDEGIPADKGDLGELKGYELPLFDTWSRQLRNARKALGEQKYTARSGRDTGRSIVSGDRIEYQNPKGH